MLETVKVPHCWTAIRTVGTPKDDGSAELRPLSVEALALGAGVAAARIRHVPFISLARVYTRAVLTQDTYRTGSLHQHTSRPAST